MYSEFNLNDQSTFKYLLDGWKLESQYTKNEKVCQRWEKNLGFFSKIGDLIARVFLDICSADKTEIRLDKYKLFNTFEITKFWSGKRILIIKGTYSQVNENFLPKEIEEKKSEDQKSALQDEIDFISDDNSTLFFKNSLSEVSDHLDDDEKLTNSEVKEESIETPTVNSDQDLNEIIDQKSALQDEIDFTFGDNSILFLKDSLSEVSDNLDNDEKLTEKSANSEVKEESIETPTVNSDQDLNEIIDQKTALQDEIDFTFEDNSILFLKDSLSEVSDNLDNDEKLTGKSANSEVKEESIETSFIETKEESIETSTTNSEQDLNETIDQKSALSENNDKLIEKEILSDEKSINEENGQDLIDLNHDEIDFTSEDNSVLFLKDSLSEVSDHLDNEEKLTEKSVNSEVEDESIETLFIEAKEEVIGTPVVEEVKEEAVEENNIYLKLISKSDPTSNSSKKIEASDSEEFQSSEINNLEDGNAPNTNDSHEDLKKNLEVKEEEPKIETPMSQSSKNYEELLQMENYIYEQVKNNPSITNAVGEIPRISTAEAEKVLEEFDSLFNKEESFDYTSFLQNIKPISNYYPSMHISNSAYDVDSSNDKSKSEQSNNLFESDIGMPFSDSDLGMPFSESDLGINDEKTNQESVIQLSQGVEKACSQILNLPSVSPRYFTAPESEDWVVRNPQEKYSGKNPKKYDATSSLNANCEAAQEQQKANEVNLPGKDERIYNYNRFLHKFKLGEPFQNIVKDKKPLKFDIHTDIDTETASPVLKLQNFSYSISSTQGHRPTMEDAHAAFELDGHPCFAIFDGHGGQDYANFCKQDLKRVLEDYLNKNNAVLADLNDAELKLFFKNGFVILDKEVKSLNKGNQGTTAALNVIIGSRNICINIGDSRTVIVSSNESVDQISIDGKCLHPKYSKKILEKGGYIEDDKRGGRVFNERPPTMKFFGVKQPSSLGMARDIGGSGIKAVSPVPTLSQFSVGKYMIVACDGLWDKVHSTEAGELLLLMEQKGFDVNAMSQALVKLALLSDSTDNISVMVVKNN
jgi:serine/threonine protein phosphatase PrpC